jgi:uncharacterized membrane protein YphA (DoxX/SURF4 family)
METISNNIPELLILVFILITFLQSGLDKLFDWKGNVSWLKGHFGETFLKGTVPLLVGVIMVIEIITGILAIAGIYTLAANNSTTLGLAAAVLGAITLLMLLFGQRVAKDYPGAFTITGYFMVVIFGIYLLTT